MSEGLTYALRLVISEGVKRVVNYIANKTTIAERDDFALGVWRICNHYDTLNEVVAAWPALRYVLPEELQGQDFPFDGIPKPLPEGVDVGRATSMVARVKLGV